MYDPPSDQPSLDSSTKTLNTSYLIDLMMLLFVLFLGIHISVSLHAMKRHIDTVYSIDAIRALFSMSMSPNKTFDRTALLRRDRK